MTQSTNVPVCLSIAGSDPSGGAGIQADLKVFHQFHAFGMAVPTLLTAQNSLGVRALQIVDADFVGQQLDALTSDFNISAIKLGALGSTEIVETISAKLSQIDAPIVIDPILKSSSGSDLLSEKALDSFVKLLLPCSYLLTPNLDEASLLSGNKVESLSEMKSAAEKIMDLGALNVLITGGHLLEDCTDILLTPSGFEEISQRRLESTQTHGTGCVLSAAITACLAREIPLEQSIYKAKDFVFRAIENAKTLGQGQGPMNLHVKAKIYCS